MLKGFTPATRGILYAQNKDVIGSKVHPRHAGNTLKKASYFLTFLISILKFHLTSDTAAT